MRITDIEIGAQYAVDSPHRAGSSRVEAIGFAEVSRGYYSDRMMRAVRVRYLDKETGVPVSDRENDTIEARYLIPWDEHAAEVQATHDEYERTAAALRRVNGLLAQAGLSTTFHDTVEGVVVHTSTTDLERLAEMLEAAQVASR